MWIFDKSKSDLWHKLLVCLFTFALIMSVNSAFYAYKGDIEEHYTESKAVADYIAKSDKLQKANLVFCDEISLAVLPYLRNDNITTYSCYDKKVTSFFDSRLNRESLLYSYRNSSSKSQKSKKHLNSLRSGISNQSKISS